MSDIYIYIGVALAATVLLYIATFYKRGHGYPLVRKIIAILIMFYGYYLSTLTGSYTEISGPAFVSIALGAGAGAGIGIGTWLVIGTVGVATGGIGIAVGVGTMATIGALLGGVGSTAGGFVRETLTYPLVSPWFWAPIIAIGILFFRGRRLKKQTQLSLPLNKDGNN